MECHDDMEGYEAMPHFKVMKDNMLDRSCETCHGAGYDHEEDATLENILTVVQKEQISNNCQECHKSHGKNAFPASQDHLGAGVSCLECHNSGHKHALAQPMLAKTEPELCTSCHREQMAAFSMPYAHRDGNEWTVDTIATDGIRGRFPVIAIDDADRPHVAWVDIDENDPTRGLVQGSSGRVRREG